MLAELALVLAAATAALGHYTFPKAGGGGDWQYVRKADNWQDNGFVGNVNSDQIRCFQSNHQAAQSTLSVAAGSSVVYNAAPSVYHPGPMAFYMARVSDGESIGSWKGEGAVWFKIYHEQPSFGGQLTWSSNGKCGYRGKLTSKSNQHLFHRQIIIPCNHPQMYQGRQLPPPRRASRFAQRQHRRRRPVLHLVCPARSNWRWQHRTSLPIQGVLPRRVQVLGPRHPNQHQLPCTAVLQEPWPGRVQLLVLEGAVRAMWWSKGKGQTNSGEQYTWLDGYYM